MNHFKTEMTFATSPCTSPGPSAMDTPPKLQRNTREATPKCQRQRVRRKREAIELPSDLVLADMDPKEVKRLKNRIAAQRLRERSQQQILDLQAQVEHYKQRCEVLEALVAGCANYSDLRDLQATGTVDDLLAVTLSPPATMAPPDDAENNWTSPVSSPIYDEVLDDPIDLNELDCAMLDCSELDDLLRL